MGRSELYKKFILQKSVLDTLRVYINITDDFLQQLQEAKLLEEDEIGIVKKTDWPSNRNHLLQNLIKKEWKKEEFTTFCDLLEKTQESSLVETIQKKADEYFKDSGVHFEDEMQDKSKNPVVSMLDDILTGLSLKDQNKIRRLLKEKDDKIINMGIEADNLNNKIEDLIAENADMKIRLHTLDNAATDLVSAFEYEHQPETVEEGLGIVRKILDSRQKQIDTLENHIKSLTIKLQDHKEWRSKLTSEVIELKEAKERLEKELDEVKQKYHRETFEQSTEIEEKERTVKRLQKRLKAMETYYTKEIRDREDNMSFMKRDLAIAERMQNNAEREKNKTLEELDVVREKTRKLLISLDLENEVDKLGVSLDFARNIAFAKKRGSMRMNSKQKVNPVTIGGNTEQIQESQLFTNVNLPWGNTPKDIQARRDSVSIEQMFPPLIPKAVHVDGYENEDESMSSVSHRSNLASLNHSSSLPNDFVAPRKSGYNIKLPPLGEN